ncbi:MAG: hypothetical protein HY682_08795 [Chloroflexi bacterium]|nr:hypothetical protein [Chloroflexota bacterium]
MIRHFLLAGERAIISNSYDDALGHFERAEAAAGVSPEPVDDAIMAAVLAGQARSLTSMSLDRPSE